MSIKYGFLFLLVLTLLQDCGPKVEKYQPKEDKYGCEKPWWPMFVERRERSATRRVSRHGLTGLRPWPVSYAATVHQCL